LDAKFHRRRNVLKALATVSGLGTASIIGLASALSVNLASPAYAECNSQNCRDVVILVCGSWAFVGGSDSGNAEDIARMKARTAGFNPDLCITRQ
jgi:hypothetical protein